MESLKKNLFYNSVLVFSQMAFPLIVLPYISRILGPANIGIFSLVDNFSQYFIMLAALGIPIYGIREVSLTRVEKSKLSNVSSELITIHLSLTFLLLIVYYCFLLFNHKLEENKLYFILGSFQFIVGVFSLEWFFQGLEDFKYISIRTFIVKLLSVIFIFLLVKTINDGLVYYLITTMTFILSAIINLFYLRRKINFKLAKYKEIKRHFKPLLVFFSTKFAISVYVTLTTILLGFLSTNKDVGYFSLAFKVYNMVLIIISTLTTVVISRASLYALDTDKTKLGTLINNVFSIVVLMGIPTSAFIYLYARQIVVILGGSLFLPAEMSLKILSVLIFIISGSNVFALNVLTPLRKERLFLIASCTGMIISIILNILTMPKLGFIGASISLLITEFVVFSMLFYFSCNNLKFNIPYRLLLHSIIISLFFIPIYIMLTQFFTNSLVILFGGAGICAMLFVFVHTFFIKNSIWMLLIDTLKDKLLKTIH